MPEVGLVLSGGMAKGAYQIGVLKAISEFFPVEGIRYISSASIGTVNAYAFLTRKIEQAENMWLDIPVAGLRSLVSTLLRRPYIFDVIDRLACEEDEILSYFYTACFNITKAKLNYIDLRRVPKDTLKKYLKASVALPAFSNAVEVAGNKYLDGALIDNIPIRPLLKHNPDYIIAVYFDHFHYVFEEPCFDNKIIKINFTDSGIIKNSISFDHSSIAYMILEGYEKSKTLFESIFQNGMEDIDSIYKKIKFFDSLPTKKSIRVTGDSMLNNINKALKKIIK